MLSFSVASLEDNVGRLFGSEEMPAKGMKSLQFSFSLLSGPHRSIAGSTIGVVSLNSVIKRHTTAQ